MSIPIPSCLFVAAVRGDAGAEEDLRHRLCTNWDYGHYLSGGCNHTPPCTTTPEQYDALEVWFQQVREEYLEAKRKKTKGRQSSTPPGDSPQAGGITRASLAEALRVVMKGAGSEGGPVHVQDLPGYGHGVDDDDGETD